MTARRLAIFDVDGTLIDSQAHIAGAMEAAFAAEGLPVPAHAEVLGVVGLSLPLALEALTPDAPTERLDRMVEAYRQAFFSLRVGQAASPLFPGAAEALDALLAVDGMELGIATGKSRRGLDAILASHGLGGHFATRQVSDDHPSKPHPSMVLAALAETGVAPERAVMIGDTEFDMEMGRAAGVRTLAVAWGYHPAERLGAADAVVERFADLPRAVLALVGETA
ncbi:HAD-IA family hydrolase [Rhodovulum sulfidophilum]|uniref:HAD-IA family hydrolase n=1 Tax=Rhodovulum sulfidophilum TaxID=35806 RepID=UPI001389DF7B|nr:HAD-IA family hydrolase [Rhodovulum sulfidophilum]NDK35991.1 HAD-IA family hydrolase [Rhodovulum sulfidophilum]